MDQANKILLFLLVLVIAVGASLLIFNKLGLLKKVFPNGIGINNWPLFSNSTSIFAAPTPTPDVSQITPTPQPQQTSATPTQIPTSIYTTPWQTKPTMITQPPTSQIPNTGLPTIVIPLLFSAASSGWFLKRKSR